jgi:hypothetical protein
MLKLPTPEQAAREQELEAAIKEREAVLESKDVTDAMAAWRATLTARPAPVQREALVAHWDFDGSLADTSGRYQHGQTLKGDPTFGAGQVSRSVSFDAQTLVTLGTPKEFDVAKPFTVAFWFRPNGSKQSMPVMQQIDEQTRRGWEIWMEDVVLVDIQKRAQKMSFRLTSAWPGSAVEVRTKRRFTQGEWVHIAIASDGKPRASSVLIYVNGSPVELEVVKDALNGPVNTAAELRIGVREPDAKAFSGTLDDLRLYGRELNESELRDSGIDYAVRAVLSGVGGQPAKADEDRIRDYYLRYVAPETTRTAYGELRDLRAESTRLEKQILTTMVMSELEKPQDTFVLARGDYRNRTEKVEPGTPAVLPPLPQSEGRPSRLMLAKWLLDPSHPLTARVAVNRYWQMYFGIGLVKTAENFGSQGEPPSHPELLDWLATEFIRSGWDVRAMQRLIVTSAAYKRASNGTQALIEKDPENRLRKWCATTRSL